MKQPRKEDVAAAEAMLRILDGYRSGAFDASEEGLKPADMTLPVMKYLVNLFLGDVVPEARRDKFSDAFFRIFYGPITIQTMMDVAGALGRRSTPDKARETLIRFLGDPEEDESGAEYWPSLASLAQSIEEDFEKPGGRVGQPGPRATMRLARTLLALFK